MQAVPLDFLSGEQLPAQQNEHCELAAGSARFCNKSTPPLKNYRLLKVVKEGEIIGDR